MPDPDPKPEPQQVTIDLTKVDWAKWGGPLLICAGLVFLGFRVAPSPGPAPTPLPPAPVVIEQPRFDPIDTIAKLNGKRLDPEKTKLYCDAANNGDGTITLEFTPVGKETIYRKVTVSGGVVPPIPVPPGPNPPDPPPIPTEGFRVLIVYENNPSDPAATLTKEQRGAMSSQAVRSYLDSKCAKGKDGKTPEWRMWDQHVELANETDIWKDAMKLPRNVLPWIVISDGKGGFNGPLPANEAELLALLKKHGGA